MKSPQVPRPLQIYNYLISSLSILFIVLYLYFLIYFLISLFVKDKRSKSDDGKQRRFAVIIPARNEELVIGNLIDSIRKADYNQKKIDIFVVANNCDDNTALISIQKKCEIYEINNQSVKNKGTALKYFFESEKGQNIHIFYDVISIFDADNLVDKNYFNEINKSFASNPAAVQGYKSIKNFDDN